MVAYVVSSGFLNEINKKTPTIVRKFYIGASDYSSYVEKWPSIKRDWNDIKPASITVNLGNQDGTFNFFRNTPTLITSSCSIAMGVQYAVGSQETINLFSGFVSKPSYKDGKVSIRLVDKLKKFTEVVLGTSDVPLAYTTSNYLGSDLAWWLATSYGGMSSVKSTSNVDIDYEAFSRWASVFSGDSIYLNARFTGTKLAEAMRTIGRLTRSTIVVENDKLTFNRFDTASISPYDLTSNHILSVQLDIDDDEIINHSIVQAGYSVASDYFTIATYDVVTYSVNSYGRRQEIEAEQKIWYVTSGGAINLAQRITDTYKEPPGRFSIDTTLKAMSKQIGDVISFSDPTIDVSNDAFRIMGYTIDTNTGKINIKADATQLLTFFILDDPVYGLLDNVYNPLN